MKWNRFKKQPKYRNIKVISDGIQFDSKKEEKRDQELKLLLRAGIITDYIRQPKFVLQEKYVSRSGEKIREIVYKADFAVKYKDKPVWTVEDCKGISTESDFTTETKDFKIKVKLFLKRYPCVEFMIL